MKIYKRLCIATVFLGFFVTTPSWSAPSTQHLAKLLGWIPTKAAGCDLCHGYYFTPDFVKRHPHPGPFNSQTTTLHAQGPTLLNSNGTSVLQDKVEVRQPGRLLKADKATVYRNNKTGKITHIHLHGHVSMREAGIYFLSDQAQTNLANNTASFSQAVYLLRTDLIEKPQPVTATHGNFAANSVQISSAESVKQNQVHITSTNPKNAWGTAKKIQRQQNGVMTLHDASYTTCPPLSPTWQMHASSLIFDRQKGTGTVKNAVLKLKGIPVFYWPYWKFPIDNRRKSGFLLPIYTLSKENGYGISLPLYWNMAANFDATFTSRYFSKRGYQLSTLFRYITEENNGQLFFSGIADDRGFKAFKQDNFDKFPGSVPTLYANYIAKLHGYANARGYLGYRNHWQSSNTLTPRWKSDITLQYVSDPYYLHDYSDRYSLTSANQLINRADLSYNGLHWDFYTLLEAYQTLHQIDQVGSLIFNQYRRLPELDADAHYPNFWHQLNFDMGMQYVYFSYQSSFTPQTFQLPIGQRLHIRPGMSRALRWSSGYIIPSVYVDNTDYDSELSTTGAGISRPELSASRNVPIVDLDSGLYFDRDFDWHHHHYIQTLQPRLFYLYVPYVNQDKYPNYDTQLLPFSYDQLFALNRFSGFDRLDNANQLSLGLSSSILDGNNDRQLLQADVGVIYYLQQPHVCVDSINYTTSPNGTVVQTTPNCNNQPDAHFSPITGEISFNPTRDWSASSNIAWDPSRERLDNAGVNLTYSNSSNHVATIGYSLVHNIDGISTDSLGLSTTTNLVHAGSTWTLGQKWGVFGYLDYNIALKRPNSYYAGVQYDTCCWTIRFIAQRLFRGIEAGSTEGNVTNQYDNQYFVQLQLKGLGGNASGGTQLLSSTLPGYHGPFSQSTF